MKPSQKNIGFYTVILLLLNVKVFAQTEGVSIKSNAGAPHVTAMLEIESATKGLLIPRVNLTNTNSPAPIGSTPANALLVYNLTTTNNVVPGFYYWEGSGWKKLSTNLNPDLWFLDPNTPVNNQGIMRNGGTVTVGSSTLAVPVTTMQVFGPTIFFAEGPASSQNVTLPCGLGSTFGLHIGEPNNHQNVAGGHANEINYYNDDIDLQYYTKKGVRIGAYGGGNLDVSCGSGAAATPSLGNIKASGNITGSSFITLNGMCTGSDSTIKKNINLINSGVLTKLNTVNTYSYNYKTESNADKKHFGVIAQQLELQFPELVKDITQTVTNFNAAGKGSGPQTEKTVKVVDYQGITALLLKAIQEQQVIIDDLKNRVQVLEGK